MPRTATTRRHMGALQLRTPYRASGGPSDPGSWNRYAYTRGEPVNNFDPDGLADFSVTTYLWLWGHSWSGAETPSFEAPPDLNSWGLAYDPDEAARALLRQAYKRALDALQSDSCLGLFGTAATRKQGWNPTEVLKDIVNLDGLGGKRGVIEFVDKGLQWGIASATRGLRQKTITINIVGGGRGYWNSPDTNTAMNAHTLWHELGHIYDLSVGSGGSALKTPDALFLSRRSEWNDWKVDQDCFGGSIGYKAP